MPAPKNPNVTGAAAARRRIGDLTASTRLTDAGYLVLSPDDLDAMPDELRALLHRRPATGADPAPRYRPLSGAAVRQAADTVAAAIGSAMLTEHPGPLADAAWQAHIALLRIGAAADADDQAARISALRDLAARATLVRRYAHHALADAAGDATLATIVENDAIIAMDLGEPTVTRATLTLDLADDRAGASTVDIGTAVDGPRPGWTTLTATGHQAPPVTGYRHLETAAALADLAAAVASEDQPGYTT
jgi:hypothetical protein